MGWQHIPWYTITNDRDKDFGVDQWHGHNALIRDGRKVFRTYFINSRGDEALGTTWSYLDNGAGAARGVGGFPRATRRQRRTGGGVTMTNTRRRPGDRTALGPV